jgi:hypothetical protein
MAVIRQANLLGQQRLDIPHLRAFESAMAADFDILAGQIMAGKNPLVVQGFNLILLPTGTAATSLQLQVAGSLIFHPQASESGTLFQVPATRAAETLNASNARVTGSFTASAINYIGLDLRRTADPTTADLVQFLNADTQLETPKEVPLARTLDYVISVSTQDFSTTPGVLPLAKVTTDAFNNIATNGIEDARNFNFRLGSGGTITNWKSSYAWPGGRGEPGSNGALPNSDFSSGDKAIVSVKDWMNAVMSRIWEVGGGEYWYAATADRNVKLLRAGATFANGDWFSWDGTNLLWKGLTVIFDNSTGTYNVVADQTTSSAGLTNLADGECIYVDLDRTQNRTSGSPLVAVKGQLSTLGTPTVPGARLILAWRRGTGTQCVVTRDAQFPVNATFYVATTTSTGVVQLAVASGTPAAPVVFNPDANGALTVAATGAAATAITATGGAGGIGIVAGGGTGNADAGHFTGTGTGAGIVGTGGATNGIGVVGLGTGTGAGADLTGGATGPALIVRATGTNAAPMVRSVDTAGYTRQFTDWLGFPNQGHIGVLSETWMGAITAGLTVTSGSLTGTLTPTWGWFGSAQTGDTVAIGSTLPGTTGDAVNCNLIAFTGGGVSGSYQEIGTKASVFATSATGSMVVEWEVVIGSGSAPRSDIFMGFNAASSLSALPTSASKVVGIGVRKDTGGGSPDTNWQLVTASGSVLTYTDTGVIYSNSTSYFRLEIYGLNTAGYSVRAYVNGTSVAAVTTNLPPISTAMCWQFFERSYGLMHLGPNNGGGIGGINMMWNRLPCTLTLP